MITESLEFASTPVQERNVFHLVTLTHPTERDRHFVIATYTDSYTEVMREMKFQRAERGLQYWDFFDALELSLPF